MDLRSENASQSDFRPFMDGFLYLSWSQAKTAAERRVRDGESIHQRASCLNRAFVKGPIQFGAARSVTVGSSAVEPPLL